MSRNLKEINRKAMGARIRARREQIGLSREKLAAKLGVTGKFIADVEYGEKGISLTNIYKLKQILGVSADFLLEGEVKERSDEEKKRQLNENILGTLSVCSVEQLGCMEQITRLYVDSVVREQDDNGQE